MKRIASITLIMILLALLSGCGKQEVPTDPTQSQMSSMELRQQIEADWHKVGYDDITWADETKTGIGARYYGTYDGYAILFNGGGMQISAETYIKVGKEIFGHSSGFQMYAYKDGDFIWLPDAYEQGLIGDDAAAEAAKIHRAYEKTYWEKRYQEIYEKYPDQPTYALPDWVTEPSS